MAVRVEMSAFWWVARHTDHKPATRPGHAPSTSNSNEVAPWIQRIAVATETGVLHGRKGDDRIESGQRASEVGLSELIRCERGEPRMVGDDRSEFERRYFGRTLRQAERLHPWLLRSDHENLCASQRAVSSQVRTGQPRSATQRAGSDMYTCGVSIGGLPDG